MAEIWIKRALSEHLALPRKFKLTHYPPRRLESICAEFLSKSVTCGRPWNHPIAFQTDDKANFFCPAHGSGRP
jgi:hypothetical protein